MEPLSFITLVEAIHHNVRVAWSNSMLWNFCGCCPVLPITVTSPVLLLIRQKSPAKLMGYSSPE